MLFALIFLAVALTCTMFLTKNMMLGFPSLIFWAVFGAYSYTLYTTVWDTYYLLFFASFGMVFFCSLAMYGLREKTDLAGEGEAEPKGSVDMDDNGSREERKAERAEDDFDDGFESKPSARSAGLRERAEKRRSSTKANYGEFR